MPAYRCLCGINWPVAAVFSKTCIECGEPTEYSMSSDPMDAEEVAERCTEVEERKKREREVAKLYEEFERRYVEREVVKLYEGMERFAKLGFAPDQ